MFIGNLNIFPLISPSDVVNINKLALILKIIGQYDVKHIMMLPIKQYHSFEGLEIHYHYYHSSSYQTHCDTNDNVSIHCHNY